MRSSCYWTAFLLSSSSFSPGQAPSPEPDPYTFWLPSELREPQGAPVTLQPPGCGSHHSALLSLPGCIAVTSAEDGRAETTQYLILQGPDDGEETPWAVHGGQLCL